MKNTNLRNASDQFFDVIVLSSGDEKDSVCIADTNGQFYVKYTERELGNMIQHYGFKGAYSVEVPGKIFEKLTKIINL
jgi:hypothetical protein